MNPTLLTLIAAAIAAYAFKDKLGLGAGDGVTSAVGKSDAPTGPDYAKAVTTATGIAPSDGINPGVLPTGEIRTQAPATPTEASAVAAATGSTYVPVVIDGIWKNAPTGSGGSAAALYTQSSIANAKFGKPTILPAPTPDMLREISFGNSIDDLLGAAASAKFQYGGQSAFVGYSLPIYGWNYYLQRFDPGQKMLTTGNADEVVDAETFWSRRAAAGLNGIGWDGGFNSRQGTPRFGSDNQMGPYDDYNYGSSGLGCGGSCGGCSGCGRGVGATVYGSHPLS